MKHELHPNQAALSKALYVIRLRHGPFYSGGRWIRRSVASRRREHQREWDRALRPNPSYPKPWQPDEGRQSPREELMYDRLSRIRYAYPGWMRFYHGKAPALIGRVLLYGPSPRRSPYDADP